MGKKTIKAEPGETREHIISRMKPGDFSVPARRFPQLQEMAKKILQKPDYWKAEIDLAISVMGGNNININRKTNDFATRVNKILEKEYKANTSEDNFTIIYMISAATSAVITRNKKSISINDAQNYPWVQPPPMNIKTVAEPRKLVAPER